MSRAGSSLADRKDLRGAVQNETFIGRREQEQGSYTLVRIVYWLLQGYFPLGDDRGLSRGLSNYADQVIPD